MKILFVDDEISILQAIRRVLNRPSGWTTHYCTSGHEALDEMAAAASNNQPFDVVVTDMKMPIMDGATLLHEVQLRYPDTVRIVLSGHNEYKLALRTVPVAHYFVLKPFQTQTMRHVIERCVALASHLKTDQQQIDTSIESLLSRLPASPLIHHTLTRIMTNPQVTPELVITAIDDIPGLSEKTLSLANSILMGHSMTCTSISQALFRLGFQRIRHLAFSVELFENWPKKDKSPPGVFNEVRNHSLGVAQCAEQFFAEDIASDDAFIVGMMHDIGKILLATHRPETYAKIADLIQKNDIPYHEAERQLLGVDHAWLGARLLKHWEFPYPIIEAVAYHHTPLEVTNQSPGMSLLGSVYFANQFQKGLPIDADYVSMLNLKEEIDDWKHVLVNSYW